MNRRAAVASVGLVALSAAGGAVGWRWWRQPGAPVATTPDGARTAPVVRTDLTARELVPGTVGYAGDWPVVHPGPPGILTAVAPPGSVVRRGQQLYEVDGRPVRLLYGARPAWRPLATGVPRGEDVRQLEQNLVALGHRGYTVDSRFTGATAAAVRRWQSATGAAPTGRLALGTIVFAPEAVRVTELTTPVGSPVGGEPVLRASSTRQVVTVALPAARQDIVHRGDTTTVTMPGGRQVPGTVTVIGRVAVAEADSGPPTISLTVSFDQTPAQDLDQDLDYAPVQVAISTATRSGVLAVPLTALRAGAAGGYEVSVVDGAAPRPVPVRPGLLDERAGLIEVTGDGLAEGMRVEVPGS